MSHDPPSLTVRAADVGYGHIKWTDGRDPESGALRCDRCPSYAPTPRERASVGGVMQNRDTIQIDVGGRRYEVGKDIHRALHGNQEMVVMDQDFCLSDHYTARLYGAMSYMRPGLPGDHVDFLVLGLPLNVYLKHAEAVAARYTQTHTINSRGQKLVVRQCLVYPQPLGSYAHFLDKHSIGGTPNTLVVDIGFNTVDWFVCEGMAASLELSGAALRGMGAVLKAIADSIGATAGFDAGSAEIIRLLDRSLTTGSDFSLFGQPFDLTPHRAAGDSIVEEAAQAAKNAVGSGAAIDCVVVTGGGAAWYADAIGAKFPNHQVVVLDDPAFANVRGFHALGELMAGSASRAAGQVPVAAAV